jgi:hypothetical protein
MICGEVKAMTDNQELARRNLPESHHWFTKPQFLPAEYQACAEGEALGKINSIYKPVSFITPNR